MIKVFISYSQKDIEFAKRLTAELNKNKLDFWVDWEDIPTTTVSSIAISPSDANLL